MGFELFVCLFVCSLFDCRQIFSFLSSSSSFPFIYPTVSSVINWPAPPTIHRGLEWPQCLNCLSVCLSVCLIVCLFSANFLIFLLLILLFYSILLCYWPAPPTIHRGLEWPQFLNCSLFVCLIVCSLWANIIISLLILLFSLHLSYCLLCYWHAPPTIHRGLDCPQFLNCSLFVLYLFDCLSANFLIILLLILLFYSSVSCVIVCLFVCSCCLLLLLLLLFSLVVAVVVAV